MNADGADENALLHVESNRYVYVAYTKVLRYYDVRFYTGTTLLETISTPYGGTAYYSGTDPEKTGVDNPQDYEFKGWEPSPSNITGELSCYAKFEFIGCWTREYIKRNLSGEYMNDRVATIGASAFRHCSEITDVSFPNVTSVGKSAFQGCKALVSASFPSATIVGESVFGDMFSDKKLVCFNLVDLSLPLVETIGLRAMKGCTSLTTIDLHCLKVLDGEALNNTGLKTLIIRVVDNVPKMSNKNALETTPIANGTGYIYVPSALIEDYKVATNWSTYAAQFRALEDYTVDGTITGAFDETKI